MMATNIILILDWIWTEVMAIKKKEKKNYPSKVKLYVFTENLFISQKREEFLMKIGYEGMRRTKIQRRKARKKRK
jgi:hypothetical protein